MLGADSILAEVGPAGSDVTEVSATAKSFDKSPTPPPTVLRRPAPVVPQDLDDAMIISRRQGESEMISDVIGGSRPVLNSSELSCLLNDTFWREDNFNAESCAESLISALDTKGAKLIADHVKQRVQHYGICVLGLSGGRSPIPAYEKLAEDKDIDWKRVKVFLVDERYVVASEKDSNQRAIIEALISHIPIPPENFIRPNCDVPLNASVSVYNSQIRDLINNVDSDAWVTVMGIGPDGHTASLFPPYDEPEDTLDVIHTNTDVFAITRRITLSLHALEHSGQHIFILTDAGVLDTAYKVDRSPAVPLLDAPGTVVICMEKEK
ncbi:Glucosamine-6-phosphate isomerases/6-phosphogluconolactonase [Carpediemonas membranifera]|uniref:6-phosphogluconolactonase n=1 Tax=Carpediemonas membranifera TaxID=201153 RepID=A0A8J6DZA6_9EUKA|nr:Glucosamine-6-phosphate isomerases/6-phosphogluconolactonase [Carpediemonas membranifera]|eukprot:KAG9393369.1 Glucosamine-6-phosphate isomerases/6-phosphogluconolactonase [Carpediemonas membranifera]